MQEQQNKRQPSIGYERLQIGSVLLGVAIIFLTTSIFAALIDAILATAAPDVREADWYALVRSGLCMYLLAMPLSLLFFCMGRATPSEHREKLSLPVLLGLAAIALTLTYLCNLLGTTVNVLVGAITGEMPAHALGDATTTSPLWTNLIFVGILAPVTEELFFRKLVIDRLRRYGDLFAVLFSGVIFGLVHGNLYQFFYACAMGIFFGYLYLRTGRLRYTVLLHALINLFGAVYASEMLKALDPTLFAADPLKALAASPTGATMLVIYVAVLALSFIGAIVAAVLLALRWVKGYRFAPPARKFSANEWVQVLALNPALWVFAVFVVMMFL
jgi:membrane protease YdiL (CAAX protease family)